LILALTIFSLVIVALARSLQSAVQATTVQQEEQAVQEQMRSLLEWVRVDPKDPLRMTPIVLENKTTLTPSLLPLELQNKEGDSLQNLYTLKIEALFPSAKTNSIQMTVYLP
jgi:type II secretory pathway pseudopilin PulG